jgi:hypothetical protein
MNHPEAIIQAAIVRELSGRGVFLFAVPNDAAGKTSPARAARLVAMGLRSGVADLVAMRADGVACFLEVKTKTGRLSPRQKQFSEHCKKMGWHYFVVRSVDEALTAIVACGIVCLDKPDKGGQNGQD